MRLLASVPEKRKKVAKTTRLRVVFILRTNPTLKHRSKLNHIRNFCQIFNQCFIEWKRQTRSFTIFIKPIKNMGISNKREAFGGSLFQDIKVSEDPKPECSIRSLLCRNRNLSRGVHPQIWRVGRTLGVALRPVLMETLS